MSETARVTLIAIALFVGGMVGTTWGRRPQVVVFPDHICTVAMGGAVECKDTPTP